MNETLDTSVLTKFLANSNNLKLIEDKLSTPLKSYFTYFLLNNLDLPADQVSILFELLIKTALQSNISLYYLNKLISQDLKKYLETFETRVNDPNEHDLTLLNKAVKILNSLKVSSENLRSEILTSWIKKYYFTDKNHENYLELYKRPEVNLKVNLEFLEILMSEFSLEQVLTGDYYNHHRRSGLSRFNLHQNYRLLEKYIDVEFMKDSRNFVNVVIRKAGKYLIVAIILKKIKKLVAWKLPFLQISIFLCLCLSKKIFKFLKVNSLLKN